MDRSDLADALFFEGRFRLEHQGLFRLDQAGKSEPVVLGSRALDLLRLLVERQGELLAKDLIMETVWPGTAVEESNLSVQISALRRILDQGRQQGSCIQTIPNRGYRFVTPVRRSSLAAPGATGVATSRQAVDRGVAISKSKRRPGSGVFRRRHGRGDHHRAFPHPLAVRDRPQFELHLQGPSRRCEAGRP